MGTEIERKFKVTGEGWRINSRPVAYRQGYIPNQYCTFRIRIAGDKGFLTFKGAPQGITRSEYEYEIPLSDAEEMLDRFQAPHQISKIRHHVQHEGVDWVVDEFEGEKKGLIIAEIDIKPKEKESPPPAGRGEELPHNRRYSNFHLSQNPYTSWEM